ncbi:MAG: hypothetical protein RIC18_07620 [Hoeflea sp.]|uniref:hypothetical protein n=1 Tax=Hoeflea sp. TaxID=1940281 RepID=UPI0032EB8B01
MNEPLDPVDARQARQGRPVLIILAVSMVLALIAAGVLWGVVSGNDTTAITDPDVSEIESGAAPEPMPHPGPRSASAVA